jgi:hypothetical protein
LTNDSSHREADISRLKPFFTVDPNAVPIEVAAANLFGEREVDYIKGHFGIPAKRKDLTFAVVWKDRSESIEPWEVVKKLAALDVYIHENPKLRRFLK